MFKLVVLSIAFAIAAADPSILSPLGLGLGWGGIGSHLGIAPLAGINYRGPLSLAPGQPANILAADGRPLDTLSVNLDRAAHLTARAVDGGLHLLKKRSIVGAPWIGAPIGVHGAGPLVASGHVGLAPLGHGAPVAGLGWGHGLGHGIGHGLGPIHG